MDSNNKNPRKEKEKNEVTYSIRETILQKEQRLQQTQASCGARHRY